MGSWLSVADGAGSCAGQVLQDEAFEQVVDVGSGKASSMLGVPSTSVAFALEVADAAVEQDDLADGRDFLLSCRCRCFDLERRWLIACRMRWRERARRPARRGPEHVRRIASSGGAKEMTSGCSENAERCGTLARKSGAQKVDTRATRWDNGGANDA